MSAVMTGHLLGWLALAAFALATWRLARHRRRTDLPAGVDVLLVSVGGALVALVLTGMVLGVSGIGLRPATWATALAGLAVVGLATDRLLDRRATLRAPRPQRRPAGRPVASLVRLLPWAAASVAVLAVAIGVSVRSVSAADAPPLEMAFGTIDGTEVEVVVRTGEGAGPLELRTTTDGTDISYPLFDVDADGTETTTLSLPKKGRVVVTLNNPDQTQPLRTLILDR